ncbi:MAG: hypothetical protein E3J89_00970 [Candidatus Aminicenantes bacterium]|nr:MAG: hypothetical protein E3J89_00970 [Candidatus Aminicenantes bacterium]
MKKGLSLFIMVYLLGFWSFSSDQEPQKPLHFYNVDTEKKIKGTIQEIIMEPRYKGSSPFLIIRLEEKKTHQKFIVEISPVRFFTHDFHKGEELEVVGSLYSKEGSQNIIARQMRFRGEIIILRDKHGFPAWRGGGMKHQKRRKGKGF